MKVEVECAIVIATHSFMNRHVVVVQHETNLISFMNLDPSRSDVDRRLQQFCFMPMFHLNSLSEKSNYVQISE